MLLLMRYLAVNAQFFDWRVESFQKINNLVILMFFMDAIKAEKSIITTGLL